MNIRDRNGSVKLDLQDSPDQLKTLRKKITPSGPYSFFKQSDTPRFVLHVRSGMFIDVNNEFQSLFGYSRDQLLGGSVRAPELITTEERNLFKLALRLPDRIPNDRFESVVIDQTGATFPVSISIRSHKIKGQHVLYGSVWHMSDVRQKIQALEEQLEDVFQSNKQLRKLREKWSSLSRISSNLLTSTHEFEVLAKTEQKLNRLSELKFQDITFYLLDESGDELQPTFSERPDVNAIPMTSSHPAVEVVSGETNMKRPEENVLFLPLNKNNKRFGVLKIILYPEERKIMEQDETAWNRYLEALFTLSKLISLISHRCHLYRQEKLATIHDPLIGIYNRKFFNEKLEEELYRAKRNENTFSLMIIDVNDFQQINNEYGHQEGDRIIQKIGQTIERNSRDSDFLFRYGGDEFALLLTNTNGEESEQKARNILEKFQNVTFSIETENSSNKSVSIGISIGISTFPLVVNKPSEQEVTDGEIQTWLLKTADKSMFHAKESADYDIVRYDPPDYLEIDA